MPTAHHPALHNLAKIDGAEIALNRKGASSDAKANAAVAFAAKMVQTRGNTSRLSPWLAFCLRMSSGR
jgi:hypothetical protein